MKAEDVKVMLDKAIDKTGVESVNVYNRPIC